jgi:hypothetical protein
MSDRPDSQNQQSKTETPPEEEEVFVEAAPTILSRMSPTFPHQVEEDQIPVEALIRRTRQFTERITNEDRQRLALELKESGHQPTIKNKAPVTIQQFFAGEIDLDNELGKRFADAPLFSNITFKPKKLVQPYPNNVSAILQTQDAAAMLTFDVRLQTAWLEATFTLGSMLSMRFELGFIDADYRKEWLELMRRDSGIAFLWTPKRWENDYLIFVVRKHFARIYAFSPQRFEAAGRITPDALHKLLDWLESSWSHDLVSAKKAKLAAIKRATQQAKAAKKDEVPDEDESSSDDDDSKFEW